MRPTLTSGKLKTWKDDKGFGFIQPANGSQEIFLHISELKDSTRRPQVGDTIYYYAVAENGKTRAANAFILGARRKQTAPPYGTKTSSNGALTSLRLLMEVLLLAAFPLFGAMHFAQTTANPLPLILYFVMSLLTFALYADDKFRATKGRWRIPEQNLHLCELAGGWLGGFVAQRKLHHKSKKQSYQAEFWVIVALHYIGWLGWFWFGKLASA